MTDPAPTVELHVTLPVGAEPRCGLQGPVLWWYLECNKAGLFDRVLPHVMMKHADMALLSMLDPLEALIAFMREWPILTTVQLLRFERWMEASNAAIVERDRQLLIAKRDDRREAGRPGARGRAHAKPRKKAGRR